MYSKKRVLSLILATFILTSALYTAAFTFVPSLGSFLGGIRTRFDQGSDLSEKLGEVGSYVDDYFINDYDKEKMTDYAIKGYIAALDDPYSEYITREEYKELVSELSGNYKGIGIEVYVDKDGNINVISAFDDSPAAQAGILPNDKIIAVNETTVNADNYNEAINMMRGVGEYGKTDDMTITILRGTEKIKMNLTRTEVANQTVKTKMLDNNIGYIRISQFDDDTGTDFNRMTDSIIADGAKALVIDLRNNPGGVLTGVVSVADKLLGKGKIITIKEKNGKETVYNSDENEIDLPICVLINSNSASASEVLAGALKDHKKATLVGEKSFGKGIVQTIFDLSDKSALKITTAKYYTPNGTCIHGKGIKPDYAVELHTDKNIAALEPEEDTQLQKAIEILNN